MCTKDWYGIFSTALHKECFTLGEIQQIYKIEMEARTFFDFGGIVPDFLILQNIERGSKKIQYYWASRSSEAMCPFCGMTSNKECKDYFEKPIQDILFLNSLVLFVFLGLLVFYKEEMEGRCGMLDNNQWCMRKFYTTVAQN